MEERVRRAKSLAMTLARMGVREAQILDALRAADQRMDFQCAVGPYNVDGAVRELGVAVEGQWTYQPTGGSIRGERIKDLLDAGWSVLIIDATHRKRWPIDLSALAEQFVAFLNRAQRDPSIRGQYGVISGSGQPIPAPRDDLAELPRVLGF